MGFSLEHTFEVKAPAERVWAYLTDPYSVAPALPGASITEKTDEQTYGGALTLKVGPVVARYRGSVRFEALDAASRRAQIVARGKETSGRGGADLKMTSQLVEHTPGQTSVTITSEVNVTGALAQFGRGMIQDVSNQMFHQFTQAVKKELERPEPAAPTSEAVDVAREPGNASMAPQRDSITAPSFVDPGVPSALEPKPLARAVEAPPIDALSLGGKVLGRALLRTVQRPAFWVFVVLALALIYWLASS